MLGKIEWVVLVPAGALLSAYSLSMLWLVRKLMPKNRKVQVVFVGSFVLGVLTVLEGVF